MDWFQVDKNGLAKLLERRGKEFAVAELLSYMGPADRKIRPFCHARVGKVYTKAEIDAMDNGQLPNAFLTGGGYNCRHSWIALSKASELRDLAGTDQRIPEVEQQLASVGDRKAA